MRIEPHIYTIDVECVRAIGQQPHHLTVPELRQTHGALLRRLLRLGVVDINREGIENGQLEAAIRGGSRVAAVHVHKDLLGPTGATPAAPLELAAAQPHEVPSCVEMEAHHENDDGEEHDDGAEHYFPAQCVPFSGIYPDPHIRIIRIRHAINFEKPLQQKSNKI